MGLPTIAHGPIFEFRPVGAGSPHGAPGGIQPEPNRRSERDTVPLPFLPISANAGLPLQ